MGSRKGDSAETAEADHFPQQIMSYAVLLRIDDFDFRYNGWNVKEIVVTYLEQFGGKGRILAALQEVKAKVQEQNQERRRVLPRVPPKIEPTKPEVPRRLPEVAYKIFRGEELVTAVGS